MRQMVLPFLHQPPPVFLRDAGAPQTLEIRLQPADAPEARAVPARSSSFGDRAGVSRGFVRYCEPGRLALRSLI
jgi:hypothetical protein